MSWIEPRKIIRVGEKSYAVTIPKKWIYALNLKPGEVVNLVLEKNGSICIHSKTEPMPKYESPNRVEIDLSNLSGDVVTQVLTGCYVEGYDEVIIRNAPPDIMDLLNTLAAKLPGLVVLETVSGLISIKIAISEGMVDLDDVSVRMLRVLNTMYDIMEDYIEKGSRELAEKILKIDDELDRLYFLGIRLIKRGKEFQKLTSQRYQELLDTLSFIKSIEHVGDALDRSTRILLQIDFTDLKEELGRAFIRSRKIIFDSISSYVNNDIKLISRFIIRRREFRKYVREFRLKYPSLQGVASELELISTIASDIVELAIRKYIRTISQAKK